MELLAVDCVVVFILIVMLTVVVVVVVVVVGAENSIDLITHHIAHSQL